MKALSMDAKRQKLPGARVWVVATPIGNLSDLSARAREVLASVDWVACEDTRRTAKLFQALGIPCPELRRYDEHSSLKQVQRWIAELQETQQSIALVTDAGTPGVSDPGALLVREAAKGSIAVHPVPGASSWMSVVSISGWPEVTRWVCQSFFPRKDLERQQAFREAWVSAQAVAGASSASLWLESPERILDTLECLHALLEQSPRFEALRGEGSQWLVCKELTKIYERVFRGDLTQVLEQVRQHLASEGNRGEWCFAVRFPALDAARAEPSEDLQAVEKALECLLDAGVKISEISKILSHRFGIDREKIYSRALHLKKSRD